MSIIVSEYIHLSEFRPSDQAACIEPFKEKEIYDRTLRIPYPYTDADFQKWLGIVEKATKQQGQPVHQAIRNTEEYLITEVPERTVPSSGRSIILTPVSLIMVSFLSSPLDSGPWPSDF